jgi:Tfp pilus assembly protein PilZ
MVLVQNTSLFVQNTSLFVQNTSLFVQNTSLFVQNTSLFVENTSLFVQNTSLFVQNTSLFVENTSLFVQNTSLFVQNTSLFVQNTSLFSTICCLATCYTNLKKECNTLPKPLPSPHASHLKLLHPRTVLAPLGKATVYTQVIESLPVLELPHPNPPLVKGRELDFFVSPLSKGGLRGVKPGSQSNSELCVHGSLGKGSHCVGEAARSWGFPP